MAFTQSPSLHWATSLRFFDLYYGDGSVTFIIYSKWCCRFLWGGFWVWWLLWQILPSFVIFRDMWQLWPCEDWQFILSWGEFWVWWCFFFDKLTVICDTTWHVTVVTVCRVTMQGAMGGGRGLTPAATKSRAFHTEQLEQAPQPTPFYRSPSLHCGDHQPQCACESPLGVNWVIEIGAWGGCVPLLETAERSAGRRRWRHDLVVPALVVSVREVGKGRA